MIVEAGIWLSICLYLIGWSSRFSLFQQRLNFPPTFGLRVLQLACFIHTVTLLFILFTSVWPAALIPDLLNAIAWLPIFIYLIARHQIQNPISSTSIPPFSAVLLFVSILLLKQDLPTLTLIEQAPLMHQTLLITHITALIAGYVLFGLSCTSSVLFLYQEHQIKTKLVKVLVHQFPSLATLDRISYRSVILGFLFLTVGLVLGVLLSDGLQSSRSIWRLGISLLIWLLYAFFLVERFIQGYKRRLVAIWSIIGFFLVLASLIIETVHLI